MEKTNKTRQKLDKPRRCAKLAALAARTTSMRLADACRLTDACRR